MTGDDPRVPLEGRVGRIRDDEAGVVERFVGTRQGVSSEPEQPLDAREAGCERELVAGDEQVVGVVAHDDVWSLELLVDTDGVENRWAAFPVEGITGRGFGEGNTAIEAPDGRVLGPVRTVRVRLEHEERPSRVRVLEEPGIAERVDVAFLGLLGRLVDVAVRFQEDVVRPGAIEVDAGLVDGDGSAVADGEALFVGEFRLAMAAGRRVVEIEAAVVV